MTTYNDLIKQIESLTQQAEALRQSEISSVIADIKEKMKQHGISLADLREGPAESKPGKKKTAKVAAKYRNTATGETWSGRGRTPKWLEAAEAAGQARSSFAV